MCLCSMVGLIELRGEWDVGEVIKMMHVSSLAANAVDEYIN